MYTPEEWARLELLVRSKQRCIHETSIVAQRAISSATRARHRTGNESAVIAPVEADPWATALPLILDVGALLERLVMVDAKNTWRGRSVEDQASDPWGIESVAGSSQYGH